MPEEKLVSNYYDLLEIHPSASVQQIRRAYRELSKLYHPDTTNLPAAIATAKFQELNEAYATLSSPERRFAYDLKIGYSRVAVIQPPPSLNRPAGESRRYRTSSAYLDPTDRPLSAGEIFALFILGVTFAACLILVVAVGLTRGETVFQTLTPSEREASRVEVVVDAAPATEEGRDGLFMSPPVAPRISEEPMQTVDKSVPVEQLSTAPLSTELSDTELSDTEPLPASVSPIEASTLLQLVKEHPDISLLN